MRIKQRAQPNANVPTASMADIVFLLIIFFVLTFNMDVDKAQVSLPKTNLRFEIPKKAAVVSVTEAGQIRVSGGEETSTTVNGYEDVLAFAAEQVARNSEKPFVLKADGKVPYQTVDRIMDSLKQARVQVIYLLSEQETVAETPAGS